MNYSRWLTSYWYTYWQVAPEGTEENRDTALFCICNLGGDNIVLTAKELREDLDGCIKHIAKRDGHASLVELNELTVYMDRFIEDVNEKYPLTA